MISGDLKTFSLRGLPPGETFVVWLRSLSRAGKSRNPSNMICHVITQSCKYHQCAGLTQTGCTPDYCVVSESDLVGSVTEMLPKMWSGIDDIFRLTLNVRGPSYLCLTRSISWLLMPWLLTSPGHQQPWYWLYRICTSLSYLRKNFKYLCHTSVEEWHKM